MHRYIPGVGRVSRWLFVLVVLYRPEAVFGQTTFGKPILIPVKLECSSSTTQKLDFDAKTTHVALIVYNHGKQGTCGISPTIDWGTCDLHVSPGQAVSQIFPPPTKKKQTITIKCDAGRGGCEGTVQVVPLVGAGASASPLVLLPEDANATENVTAKCGDKDIFVLTHFGSTEPQELTVTVDRLGDCDVVLKNSLSTKESTAKKGAPAKDGPTEVTVNFPSKITVTCKADNDKDKDKSCKAAVKVELSMKNPP